MTVENDLTDLHIEPIEGTKTIATWPFFSATNHLFEELCLSSHLVGARTWRKEDTFTTSLASNECTVLANKLRGLKTQEDKTIKTIERIFATSIKSNSVYGYMERSQINNVLHLSVVLYASPRKHNEFLSINVIQEINPEKEVVNVFIQNEKGLARNNDSLFGSIIHKYEPMLVGLKDILDSRARIRQYHEVKV